MSSILPLLMMICCCVPGNDGQNVILFSAASETLVRDSRTGVHFVNFLEYKAKQLVVQPFKELQFNNRKRCYIECLKELQCLSFNVATSASGGQYICQLLDSLQVQPELLTRNQSFSHFCMQTKCHPYPCLHGGTCVPHLNNDIYSCLCELPYHGVRCNESYYWNEWSAWTSWGKLICRTQSKSRSRTCFHPLINNTDTKDCKTFLGGNDIMRKVRRVKFPILGCNSSLGMENFCIGDQFISASSNRSIDTSPFYARLNKNLYGGGWVSKGGHGEYLQIDCSSSMEFTKVATQGVRGHWVKTYTLKHGRNQKKWTTYGQAVITGNTDATSVVSYSLDVPFVARHIRFVVKTYYGVPSMRVEVYGCDA